jgi:hypothetical protein
LRLLKAAPSIASTGRNSRAFLSEASTVAPQDAKDIIDRNTADDNAAYYMRLAERIIQQQDAAVPTKLVLSGR